MQHVPFEGPGLIAKEALHRGLSIDVVRIDLGTPVSKAQEIAGLILMGGPMGVYEADKYPVITEECRLIAETVAQNLPVLGVCFGSQLLAKAIGGEVFPGHQAEVGIGTITLTKAGIEDPLFRNLEPEVPVFHWHGDTFSLPSEATLLASSAVYPHQAFRYGELAYGLQFHVEPDAETWTAWQPHLPAVATSIPYERKNAIEQAGRKILSNFFDLALA